jgi:hypothetical protein
MFQMQYFVPEGYQAVNASLDKEISDMCARLKGVDKKDVQVPDSALSIRLFVMENGSSVEIKKRGQMVYTNLFCFDSRHFQDVFCVVEGFYLQYNLGVPRHPKIPTWIHSIPIAHNLLRENEIFLCQKMTVSFYWAVFAQQLKKSNPMN